MQLFREYRGLRKELYILFVGRLVTNLGGMIWPMLTLILSGKIGMNAETIGICMMLYSIAALPVSLLGGKLADRLNKKMIIVVCDLVSILSYLYCSLVPITFSAVVIFAAASLFQSAEWASYDALVADFTTSENRERAYSLSYLGSNLGLVLAPTIGGLLFNNYLNLAFLINGVSIAFSTVLIFFLIKDVQREKDDSPESAYEAEIDDHTPAVIYILKNRVIRLYLIVSALCSLVYAMFNYLMPLDLTAAHGDSGAVLFGSMTSVNCVVVVVFTALITRWFHMVRDGDKLWIGEGLILCGYVIFVLFVRNTALCFVSITIFTIGEIFQTLSQSPFLTRRIPASHRGRILSVVQVCQNLFTAAMILIVGSLYDNRGPMTAWMFVFVLGGLSMFLLFLIRYYDKKDYPFLQKNGKRKE